MELILFLVTKIKYIMYNVQDYHVHYNNAVRLHVIHMWKGVIVKQETKQKQNQAKRDTTETKRNQQKIINK